MWDYVLQVLGTQLCFHPLLKLQSITSTSNVNLPFFLFFLPSLVHNENLPYRQINPKVRDSLILHTVHSLCTLFAK